MTPLLIECQQRMVGRRVKALVNFAGVPKGTEGVIDEFYVIGNEPGLMVAWDLPGHPLPEGYREYDGRPAVASGLLRDGFNHAELNLLGLV